MPLNPFFLQGSQSEQSLIQQIINEQLRMYGVEVIYIPRKYLNERSIIKENVLSEFDENYAIEAYVKSYDGFGGGGDVLGKFGIQAKDELNLIISKERYEDYVSVFLTDSDGNVRSDYKIATRPAEGDLVYFPLTDVLYEVKFVEHEVEFYQLQDLYVFELVCEPFEFEDEVIDTGIDEIDDNFEESGYAVRLTLSGIGSTGRAVTELVEGGVSQVYLLNDGYDYSSAPIVTIGSPGTGVTATAVAIMTDRSVSGINTYKSVSEILLTNPGSGYTVAPAITFSGGGGTGAAATVGIRTSGSIGIVSITSMGAKYLVTPSISFTAAPAGGVTATAVPVVSAAGTIAQIRISNAGFGYTEAPQITIGDPAGVGTGNFVLNELITGSASSATAKVKTWDRDTLELNVSNLTGTFRIGEVIVGSATTFEHVGLGTTGNYAIKTIETMTDLDGEFDSFTQNEEIQDAADQILDFSERHPFGEY